MFIKTYSHSRLKKFMDCPFRFYKVYIEKAKEPVTQPLALGIATHTAIEEIAKGTDKSNALTKGLEDYPLDIPFDPLEYTNLVERSNVRPGIANEEDTEVEHHFVTELDSQFRIQGFIDLLQTPFGSVSFKDWKTNRLKYHPMETYQLALYSYGLAEKFNVDTVQGTLHFLRYRNPEEKKTFTKKEMIHARDWAMRNIEKIENSLLLIDMGLDKPENQFCATPSSQCQHCPFVVECHNKFSKYA